MSDNLVRLGSLFTRIYGCRLDVICGEGMGLLEKFVTLTMAEAVAGNADRQCREGELAHLDIIIDAETGDCSATCTQALCEFNRARRK